MHLRRMVVVRCTLAATLLFAAVGCASKPTPLMTAARTGDLATTRSLLKSGAAVDAPDSNGLTALHWAAKTGQVATMKALIQEGRARVDAPDEDRQTPLHLACKYGQPEAAYLLLNSGASPNAKDVDGWTALHFAARKGSPEIIRALAARGADLNAVCREEEDDDYDTTPLDLASGQADDTLRELGAKEYDDLPRGN